MAAAHWHIFEGCYHSSEFSLSVKYNMLILVYLLAAKYNNLNLDINEPPRQLVCVTAVYIWTANKEWMVTVED